MGTIIDIVILVVLAVLSIRGLFQGLIRELLAIAAIVVGIILARTQTDALTAFLSEYTSIRFNLLRLISLGLLFLLGYTGVKLLEGIFNSFIKALRLSGLNRITGVVLGFIEGALIVLIVDQLLRAQPFFDVNAMLGESKILPLLKNYGFRIIEILRT